MKENSQKMTENAELARKETNPSKLGAIYESQELVFGIKELTRLPAPPTGHWRSGAIHYLEPGEQMVYQGKAVVI